MGTKGGLLDLKNQRDRPDFRNTLGGYPNKRPRGRRWWKILVPLLLACLVLAALVVADYWVNHGKIYPGVAVGDINLGGKTPEEARKVLEERTGALKEIKLTGPQQFTIPSDKLGVNFDVQATVDRAYAVGRQGDMLKRLSDRMEATWGTVYTPLSVNYKREQLREGLSDVFTALTAEPAEAGFRFDGNSVSVTKSQTGMQVEKEKLLDNIEAGLIEGRGEFEVPVITQEPKLTTEEAEKLKPTAVLARYRTDYRETSDKSKERVENLRIASNAISGKFLAPGEVFSMVDVASPLDYNKTSVIINGKEDKADGGGLCQVTSTLYMAANYAGLEIVERHPHATQLPYIRPGLDATVWFGSLDMKFKNTTDGYLLLQESVGDDGYIYASIYGRPTGKEVEMNSEPEYVGADSSKWITYQKIKENGKVTFDDVIHKDTYQPLVDEHGKIIPPNSEELNVAPVNP